MIFDKMSKLGEKKTDCKEEATKCLKHIVKVNKQKQQQKQTKVTTTEISSYM